MIEAILAILAGILKVIPIVNKWFTESTAEKVREEKEEFRDDVDHFKKTGRPKW